MKDNLILVYYISINGIDENEIPNYFSAIRNKIASQTISENSEIIFMPVQGENRVECINPKYITDSDLIKKHERLMSELHEHLSNQIIQLKEENDG